MPVIFLKGGDGDEQGFGAPINAGATRMYAVNRQNTLAMYDLGGHRVTDAPDYTLIEPRRVTSYISKGGFNITEERVLTDEAVRRISLEIMLPHAILPHAKLIKQQQFGGCEFDYIFVPIGCTDECDEYFRVLKQGRLGVIRDTTGPVSYGEDGGNDVVSQAVTLEAPGDWRYYYGLKAIQRANTGAAVHAVRYTSRDCDCGCPNQIGYAGGVAFLSFTESNFGSLAAVDITAITAELAPAVPIITDIAESNGIIVVSVSDAANAVGTDGTIGYITTDGGAALVSTLDTPSTGVQALVTAFGKVYAFGTGGEIYASCNNGIDFSLVAVPAGLTDTIIDADYDNVSGLIYLVTDGPTVWTMDSSENFTDITTLVNPNGATTLLSVRVLEGDHVVIGGSDGALYETFNASEIASVWSVTYTFTADPIHALEGDNERLIATAGQFWNLRDAYNKQVFVQRDDLSSDILSGHSAVPLPDEGKNYFVFGTTDGDIFTVSPCVPCVTEGC